MNKPDEEIDSASRLLQCERENRKLRREVEHLKNAIVQEKVASTTVLNQYKSSTFLQRERERYLTLLLSNSPSIILFLGNTGRIEFCTEYFLKKAGFNSGIEVQGRTLTEVLSGFLDGSTHETLQDNVRNVVLTNTPIVFDARFCFVHGGVPEDFAGLLVPMKDEQQRGNGVMLMFHDVTDLKRSQEEALAASKAKSSFLSNMSHEIRTPLNAIIGMTTIGKRTKDPERKGYAFEKIESASIHLLGVINDVLDISKIESGKMELSNVVFDFSEIIDRVIGVTALKMQDKKQNFSVAVDPEIPNALFGDDQRLAQVLTNILSNAAKFTPEGGSIALAAKVLDKQDDLCTLQVAVKDSGIGISSQEQTKLFNIFQQAQAGTTRQYGGSGLGLVISKRILELMGGKIWVESEKGEGACFIFTVQLGVPLNVATPVRVNSESRHASGEENEQNADFSGKYILLADDVDINLEIAVALLEPTNVRIDTAKNGKEAVDAFAANPGRYDLIFMDVQMPEVDGLEATKMIRALPDPQALTIPIIAITANVFKEDIEKCMAAGMNDHLGKPMVMQDVMKILSRYFCNA